MTWFGLRISISPTVWMSPAVTTTRTLLAHDHALGIVAIHLDGDFLDVEHDVRHVFANAGDRGEFVQHAVDLHGRHSGTAQRGQQNAAKRVAEGEAETALKRLCDQSRLGARAREENSTLFGLINSCQFF